MAVGGEAAEGTVRVEKARPRRATAPVPVPVPRGTSAKDSGRIAATRAAKVSAATDCNTLAAQLLAAPPTIPDPAPFDGGAPFATDTEEIVAGWAKCLQYDDVRQLAHAIDTGQAITVEYVATSGNQTVRTPEPASCSTRPTSKPGATSGTLNGSSPFPASAAS
ncbi:hypothetical protein ABT032_25410 [Streptomyces flaveus]